jgi:hypothetical protein
MSEKTKDWRYKILWAIMQDPLLTAPSKCAATILLLKFANNRTRQCNPSFGAVAKKLGRHRRNVIAAVNELKARGWIEWSGTKGGSPTNTNAFVFMMSVIAHTGDGTDTGDEFVTGDEIDVRGDEFVTKGVTNSPHEQSSEQSKNNGSEGALARFLPDDFRLDDETHSWALALLGSNDAVDRSVERFCNHYAQVSGPKAKSRNWLKKVRIWIDDDAKRPSQSSGGVIAASDRLRARLAAFDAPALDDDAWNGLLSTFVRTGIWTRHTDQCGSAPPSPYCRAPRHLLERHGISLETAA